MAGQTLRVIGFLLNYPDEAFFAGAKEGLQILRREKWLSAKMSDKLQTFADKILSKDIMDIQEEYVALFDRTPSLSLYLFEHVYGDSRDRGQALVEIDGLYREKGLENVTEHTPDYLPMFLEYLSLLTPDEARDNLDGAIDVIGILRQRLEKRGSPYAVLFEALEETAARKPDEAKLINALKEDSGMPLTSAQMDAAWEEQFAFDDLKNGAQQDAGCPKAEEMLARMGVPATSGEKRHEF